MLATEPRTILAEGAAHNLIQSFGISLPKDIVLEDIALCRGVLVMEGELIGAEARLVRKGNKGLIRVRAGLPSSGQRRFAIAHELGHWELHKDNSQWQFCTENDIRDYSGSPLEVEANVFASELLMPSLLFRPHCEGATPDLERIKTLAEEYDVSLTAAAVRFVEETDAICFVVFSENDKVRWWRRSQKCEGLWIEKCWEVKYDSLAWDCLREDVVQQEGLGVEPSVWFGQSCAERLDGKIEEQSIRLGKHPTVLTLLIL